MTTAVVTNKVPSRATVVSVPALSTPHKSKRLSPVRVGDLMVDPALQRELKESRVKKIVAEFDEKLLEAIVVSKRDDGTMHVCDGQHRFMAAKEKMGDNYMIDAVVHTGLTREQEASMYRGINNGRAKTSAYDDYRIGLEAGDPICIEIDTALTNNNLRMSGSSSANVVSAASACKRIVEKSSGYLLEEVLAIAIEAWGRHAESYDADILQAIAELYLRNKNVQTSRVITVLRALPVWDWKQQGVGYNKSSAPGASSRAINIAQAFAAAYNKRLQPDNRIGILKSV